MLKTRTRKVVALILLIFAAYSIYTAPGRSADAVQAALNVLEGFVSAVFRFFDSLIR